MCQHHTGKTRSKNRIVIVDDTEDLARTYAQSLKKRGYDAAYTLSGADFMRRLARDEAEPELLILDVKLPDTDGLQLLSELKLRGFNAPVIVVTGHASMNMAIEAMRAGATDFLVKPFPLARLYDSVEKALGSAGLIQKSAAVAIDQRMGEDDAAENSESARSPSSEIPSYRRENFGGFIGISPPDAGRL